MTKEFTNQFGEKMILRKEITGELTMNHEDIHDTDVYEDFEDIFGMNHYAGSKYVFNEEEQKFIQSFLKEIKELCQN